MSCSNSGLAAGLRFDIQLQNIFASSVDALREVTADHLCLSEIKFYIQMMKCAKKWLTQNATNGIRSGPTKSGCKHLSSTESIAQFDSTC
jgi:hypothetical protein